jgi:ribose 5-phosphate isomerase B
VAPVKKIIIGSDHAGFQMKEFIKSELEKSGIEIKDVGTYGTDSVDYPVFAGRVAKAVSDGEIEKGILICGSGIGVSMTANRFKGVRAALCMTEEMAMLSRQHNDANILVIAGRITTEETASAILRAWLSTDFEGGRHEKRIKLIDDVAEMESL